MVSLRFRKTYPIGAFIFLGLSFVGYSLLAMPTIQPHLGDGHFQNTSWRFPWSYLGVPVPGYEIDFPEFDLLTDRDVTYRIESLPNRPDRVGVYLAIWDPDQLLRRDAARKRLTASVRFDIYDERGELITHVQQPLATMIWAQPEGGDYGLYDLNESFFKTRPDASCTIRMRYSADPRLKDLKGFVHIRCGCSI
jgi:hypothetical protein